MGILDKPLAALGYTSQKSLVTARQKGLSLSDVLSNSNVISNSTTLTNQKEQLRSYKDWVYAAARAIAEDAATVDFELYINRTATKNITMLQRMNNPRKMADIRKQYVLPERNMSGDVVSYSKSLKGATKAVPALEELENHPLLDLLYAPNPFMTKDEFIEMAFLHMELAGEAFWMVMRDTRGVPIELWPLMPHLIQIIPDSEKFIKGYLYQTPSGKKMPLDVDDVIHHKYSNPLDLYRGMSVVMAAARAVDTDAHAADWNRNFFQNSAMPSMSLSTDGTLSDQVFERLKQEWDTRFGGTANAHKVAILEEGLKATPLMINQKEMDFLESRKFNRDQILALFRVSAAILGIQENSNRATAEAAEFTFAKRVIKPKMMRMVNRITEDLAIQFDTKLIVGFADPVPEDKEFKLKEKQAAANTWKTVNEIRAEDGDETAEGGDQLFIATTMTPLAMVVSDPNAVDDPDEEPMDTNLDEPEDVIPEEEPAEKSLAGVYLKKKVLYLTHDEREEVGAAFNEAVIKISSGYEASFLKASRSFFDKQKLEVLKNLKKNTKDLAPRRKKLDDLFNIAGAIKQLVAAFQPIYKANIKEVAQEAMLLVSAHGFDIEDPNIIKYFEQRAGMVSKGINEETDKQLRATLSAGINDGESIDELSARVESVYGSAAGFRADRIARTESTSSATFGQIEAWQQSGVVEAQEWFTAMDERVCDYCGDMDGKIIGLGDNYFNQGDSLTVGSGTINLDFENIDGPPLHASCRCTLLPVVKDISEL